MNGQTADHNPTHTPPGSPAAPLPYRSPDPARTITRERTLGTIAISVLYGALAIPLFALSAFILFTVFGDRDPRYAIPRMVFVFGLAMAALLLFLGALMVYWMWKYIRSLG